MDLTQLANLGEFIGGVAVLVTLVYLAVQVRQGNAVVRSQVHQEMSRRSTDLTFFLADPERVALTYRSMADYDGVSEEDRFRTSNYFVGFVNYYESLFYARERGEVDDDLWESRVTRMKSVFSLANSAIWKERRLHFGERFRDFIESEVMASDDSQVGR